MWYGSPKKLNLNRIERNTSLRTNWRDRRMGKTLPKFRTQASLVSTLYIPAGWKFILLSRPTHATTQLNVYAYNSLHFLNFTIPYHAHTLKYDAQTSAFHFNHTGFSYCYRTYLAQLVELVTRLNKPFFVKIRFKGKGYYMYKNLRNTIAPQFGYAHRVYVYAQATSVKFLSKTKIILFGLSKTDILLASYQLKRVKPVNIFTGRGVRFARQILYRKTGKVSSYR